jgi:hypothetical protein
MAKDRKIEALLDRLPDRDQIRNRLSENLREAKLLRQLLKIAEQREKVEEAQSK